MANSQGSNAQDIFTWSRPTGSLANSTGNITMMFPKAINLAAPGQMTVGPAPTNTADLSLVLATFTGQKTTATGSAGTPRAGSITVQPGLLTALSLSSTDAQEGALQILQGYISMSTADSTPPTPGLLACPGGASSPQTATNCTTTGAAENWIGVFNSIQQGSPGVSVVPIRYGRVPILSVTGYTGLPFNPGNFVCKDDANAAYVISNGTTPCPIGESVGIEVGDYSGIGANLHLVDLVPEASVSGAAAQGQVLQFSCTGSSGSGSGTGYVNGGGCNNTGAGEFSLPFQGTGTYTLKNMYVNYTAFTGSVTIALFVNNVQTLNCTATGTQCTDPTSTTITSGQKYSIRLLLTSASISNVNVTIQLQ